MSSLKPTWLKTKIPSGETYFEIKKDLRTRKLATVCEEAKCPNIGECWNTRTATFMICGDTCTRACRFCNVKTGNPQGFLNPHEPEEVAQSTASMNLKYVVITMVDRDDLEDGAASHVKKVLEEVKRQSPSIIVEFLGGDFRGNEQSLETVLSSKVHVYAHNLETVESLTPRVRDARANYRQSLQVLQNAKKIASKLGQTDLLTKSALMLGLGETPEAVLQAMKDLRSVDVDFLTIGQYMRPSKKHLSVKDWVDPSVFKELEQEGMKLGFKGIASSPLVRSSYKAYEFYLKSLAL